MGVSEAPVRSRREARLAHNLEYTIPLPGQSISNMNLRFGNYFETIKMDLLCPSQKIKLLLQSLQDEKSV